MNADFLRPWPRVKWDSYDLDKLSAALLVMNPSGFADADSQASYIRSLAVLTMSPHTAWRFATQPVAVGA